MKKQFLAFLLFLAIAATSSAQNVFPLPTGNVGIGTTTPQANLDLGYGNGVKALFYGSGGTLQYYWGVGVNLGQSPNEASIFIGGTPEGCCGAENFAVVSADHGGWPYAHYTTRFVVNSQTGNVGIGTLSVNDPTYKLYVEKGIRTRKVVVDQTVWSDFVFQPNYRKLPLDKVDSFIKENHHLPDMPSADSVAKNGLNLGDNQAKLLQKIEELTLYVIELHKEIEELKKQNPGAKSQRRH